MFRKNESRIETISMKEAIESLYQVRGDIICAVLFLPIALAIQNIAEEIFRPFPSSIILLLSKLAILAVLLFAYIMEAMAISLVILNLRKHPHLFKKFSIATLTLIFMLAVTVMGFGNESKLFQVAFVVSIATSFGQLCLAEWNLPFDKNLPLQFLWFCIMLSIGIVLEMPIKYTSSQQKPIMLILNFIFK